MLSAVFHARDLDRDWVAASDGWTAGQSFIHPYANPALHAALLVSPRRIAAIVRERIGGTPVPETHRGQISCAEDELDAALLESRAWPLEFLEVLVSRSPTERSVSLRCGQWGTAPVYLTANGESLRVDWNATRLYPHLRSSALDPGLAAEYVMGFDQPYSRRTVFPGMWRLTERSVATWRPGQEHPEVAYPPPVPRARPGRLAPGADVAGTFREILCASMRRWCDEAVGLTAVELSGGLDSSIVTAGAAELAGAPVHSFGLIMPGPAGAFQWARRQAVIDRFGLVDRTLPAIAHPPFGPTSRRVRERCVVPWDEFYAEAVGAMLGLASETGATMIFTGMGGDELCSLRPEEKAATKKRDSNEPPVEIEFPPFATGLLREVYSSRLARLDTAPQSLLYTSTLESAAAVSTLYLSAGIWPVSPLCTPELVEFCRRLPQEWRRERVLHREVLTSFGYPALVTHPQPETLEHFDDVMNHALREASADAITELFRAPRLAEQGLVDGPALAATYASFRGGDMRHYDFLLGTLMLELTLRSLEHQRSGDSTNES